jgi:hypothetical protein
MTDDIDRRADGGDSGDLDDRIDIVDPLGGDRDRDDAPVDQDADPDQVDSADADQRASTEGTRGGGGSRLADEG